MTSYLKFSTSILLVLFGTFVNLQPMQVKTAGQKATNPKNTSNQIDPFLRKELDHLYHYFAANKRPVKIINISAYELYQYIQNRLGARANTFLLATALKKFGLLFNNQIHCINLNIQDPRTKWTALHHACFNKDESNSLAVIQTLILSGADLNMRTSMGDTPGHIAIARNNLPALRLLRASNKLNMMVENTQGRPLLQFAAWFASMYPEIYHEISSWGVSQQHSVTTQ